ncbi:MAG: hypothetical protein JJT94_04570, partial [Bernardetiaceae bacterium]|nr:hypothetical protein [Bernardetiaceae bacterium]
RETALSLHLYDFHARQQDPQLGRFWGVDALASKYFSLSPFAHVANNPLIFIDPDGKEIFTSGNSTTYTGADAVNFVASMQAEMGASSIRYGFYDKDGEYLGPIANQRDNQHIYVLYKNKDIKTVQKNADKGLGTDASLLKDPVLIPDESVRTAMYLAIIRSYQPNNKRSTPSGFSLLERYYSFYRNTFLGDDSFGGFHEEGGFFSQTNFMNAKPGNYIDIANSKVNKGSINLMGFASDYDRRLFNIARGRGSLLGTFHVHIPGKVGGIGMTQKPSKTDTDMHNTIIERGYFGNSAYGIVAGARNEMIYFYRYKGKFLQMSFDTFFNLGRQ